MLIQVIQDDIDQGAERDCKKCPIALAISRALPGKHVEVNFSSCTIDSVSFNLPEQCTDFILDFDCGVVVKPFSFELQK